MRSKDDFTRMLAKTSTESAAYAGGSGNIDDSFADLVHIDRLYLPIREDGVFKEGVRLDEGSKYVFVHTKDMLSHAYLHTHDEGVLHVLPGWDHSNLIRDISYRFHQTHSYVAEVPFLGGEVCRIRKFNCKGLFVCPASSAEYRNSAHCDVDPEDKNILESLETQGPYEVAKKKVVGIYQSLKDREERRKGLFCGHPIPNPNDLTNAAACRGGPKIVLRKKAHSNGHSNAHNIHLRANSQRRCDYFVGCSNYQQNDMERGINHYYRSLDIHNDMVPYLERLISGAEKVDVGTGDCHFVREKNKGKKKCPKHGHPFSEVLCTRQTDVKGSNHKMCTFEPVIMLNVPMEHRILYVSCTGEHLHPPPPPPEATAKKLQTIQEVCKETGIRCSGKLRKEVQRRLLEAKKGGGVDGKRRFEGSLAIPDGCITKTLKSLRIPIPKLASEVGELAILAADRKMVYVRDSKMVDGGHAFFLTLDELLLYACTAKSFAGEATFRTVTEANRAHKHGRWYLYNIVAHASADHLNGSGVVVMRVLITGLTKEYYYAIWKYFFDSLVKASNLMRGEQCLDYGTIKVPHMEVPPALEPRTCLITSITMDFDTAEVHGCAEALRAMCGGTMEMHINGMFIGCEVHLKRDLLRRARDGERQRATGMTSTELNSRYTAYAYASNSEEAESQLQKIKSFDSDWVNWVERQCMGPLISPCLSQMTAVHRTIGFSNTNVVESHNRRGNHLVGTRLRPADAARGLYNIDRVDADQLRQGAFNKIREGRVRRNRSDSILRPVPSGNLATKKRSKTGGGPVQKKSRTTKKKSTAGRNTNKRRTGKEMDSEPAVPRSGAEMREKEREYTEISSRFQEGLAALRGKIHRPDGKPVSAEIRAARLDTLVQIMTRVHAAGTLDKVDKVKSAILDGLESSRDDIDFREALFEMFISCLGSSAGLGDATDRIAPASRQVQGAEAETESGGGGTTPHPVVPP